MILYAVVKLVIIDRKEKEERKLELRSQISSLLISIDSYIKNLSTEGIIKKESFVDRLNIVRSRPVNSPLSILEEDLKTCREDQDQARSIANLISTQEFTDYIDELSTITIFDERSIFDARLSEFMLVEHRRLSDQFNQFDISGYIEISKQKIEKKVEHRKKEEEERLERERALLYDFKCFIEDRTTQQLRYGPTFSRTWSYKKY